MEIFAHVLQKVDAHLLMVGDGPDLHESVKLARDLGITRKVSFLGNREDVAYLLAASDILLMPSESESFGLAALEAMACGCAVVASDIGGLPELIHNGEDGFLCQAGDAKQMSDRVLELIENKQLLRAIQKAARKRAIEGYSAEVVVPRYLSVYYDILGIGEVSGD